MSNGWFKKNHIFMVLGILLAIVSLYWAKTSADKMRNNVKHLQKDIAEERAKISEIEAQITYFTAYGRIEDVAKSKLGMVPINGPNVATLDELDEIAPIVKDKENKDNSSKKDASKKAVKDK